VDQGEYVAVIGANGSGKTTLAKHLNGILLPSGGEIHVDGDMTSNPDAKSRIRSTVGMVFQSPDDQLVATIVREDVAFGPENLGVPEEELPGVVESALKRVGMWEERLRPPHQLSAGQKQRVALAGVLAIRPRSIVLDEATSMLDPVGAEGVLNIIDELHRDGMTVIAITHKMEEAARARRILVMHRGRIVADDRPAAVFQHSELQRWNLSPPPAAVLASRLRKQMPGLPEDLFTVEELVSGLIRTCRGASRETQRRSSGK
jgi:energy-coupling factor transporter ATPase